MQRIIKFSTRLLMGTPLFAVFLQNSAFLSIYISGNAYGVYL